MKRIMARAKKVVVAEEKVVEAPVVSAPAVITVRIKKGNTFTTVEFTPAVQGPDFENIAKHYAKMMGGEIV